MQINDLFTDLADGKTLMRLLEIISGESLGKPNKGVLRVQKIENVNKSIMFLNSKVSVVSQHPAARSHLKSTAATFTKFSELLHGTLNETIALELCM